jgi:hypothetical protein
MYKTVRCLQFLKIEVVFNSPKIEVVFRFKNILVVFHLNKNEVFFHISSSWVETMLHAKNQLHRLHGRKLR